MRCRWLNGNPGLVAASGGALASLGLGFLAVESNIRWF
jgi:hypothetical protein